MKSSGYGSGSTVLRRSSRSVADTQRFAADAVAAFGPDASYALEGDLGSGKTCFVQGLCEALGIRATASSPTFAVANEYRDEASGRRLVHLDLYRLDGPRDLESIGWDDYLDSGDPVAVEWPERAGRFLPGNFVRVRFSAGPGPDDRTIEACGPAPDRRRKRGGPARAAGSALVMALLVVVVLSALVLSLAFEARLESQFARYLRDRTAATRLAESGVEIAKMLMERAGGRPAASDVEDDEDRWHDAAERLAKGQSLVGLVEPVGDGYVILDIEPEPGRLNVNLLTREDWETILGNAGVPEEYFDWIIDPVLDWMDEDDVSNPKGAETEDYYSLLEQPYEAKNGPFDTVRELLLVKGFSETILTGGLFDPAELGGDDSVRGASGPSFNRFSHTNGIVIAGIESMLTTYGDGKVNIQSAPYDVLRTLPDVDDILARAIMEERETLDDDGEPNPFASTDDLFARVEGLSSEIAARITVNSSYYRITATGRKGNVERRIWCIAYASGRELRFLRWCEEP